MLRHVAGQASRLGPLSSASSGDKVLLRDLSQGVLLMNGGADATAEAKVVLASFSLDCTCSTLATMAGSVEARLEMKIRTQESRRHTALEHVCVCHSSICRSAQVRGRALHMQSGAETTASAGWPSPDPFSVYADSSTEHNCALPSLYY